MSVSADTPNRPETLDSPLLSQVIAHFDQRQVPYSRLGETELLQIPCRGESGRWNCCCRVDEQWGQCQFYGIVPLQIPEDARLAMAEFIARLNCDMAMGHFELDLDDGELRLKTTVDLDRDAPALNRLEQALQINGNILDDMLPLIFAVSYEQKTPQAAMDILRGQVAVAA